MTPTRQGGELGTPLSKDWISAVGAYVSQSGATADAVLANTGTFIGALCSFLASALHLNAPAAKTEARFA